MLTASLGYIFYGLVRHLRRSKTRETTPPSLT